MDAQSGTPENGWQERLDVLLLDATWGAGHRQAARAVREALLEAAPGLRVGQVDGMEMVGHLFNRGVGDIYIAMLRHAPWSYGLFYHRTGFLRDDSPWQKFLNRLGRNHLLSLVRSLRPRVAVCTFPVPAGVLVHLRRGGLIDVPVVTVITDYTVHSQWVHPGTALYCVGSEEVRESLLARGEPEEVVRVTGIPVRDAFRPHSPEERARLRRALGLRPERPTLLVTGGAFGALAAVAAVAERLLRFDPELQLLLVAGRDRRLKERLKALVAAVPGARRRARVFGFTDAMPRLMAASDLVVTKAGGLTTAEALAAGVPPLIYRPIPGQEEANAAWLLRRQAGIVAREPEELEEQVRRLLAEPERLEALRRAARAAGRPGSARRVAA
ncbi:MAG: glycosyltransferase, partial [Clostridia bacterium]|nr:glycosyltransferase [Clostridia bacterium]